MSAINTTSESKVAHSDAEMKGWLFKWTNYLKGYQKRWFVLSNGLLSYYRNQAEMSHTCRGTISLRGAIIQTEDSTTFIISNGVQTFHIKTVNEVERQRWVTGLELAKSKATSTTESDEEDFELDGEVALEHIIKTLSVKLEQLQSYNEIINKHGSALHRTLSELESCDSPQELTSQIKEINERATLFRITTNAMINHCGKYLEIAQTQGGKWQRMLQHERDQRLKLEELLEQMARCSTGPPPDDNRNTSGRLLGSGSRGTIRASSEEDDEEEEDDVVFYDANDKVENGGEVMTTLSQGRGALMEPVREHDTDSSQSELDEAGHGPHSRGATALTTPSSPPAPSTTAEPTPLSDQCQTTLNEVVPWKPNNARRSTIPEKPAGSMQIWSILKNSIGKDLSTIPMPLNFSEPLSMLQRLTEDFEYAHVLDEAANTEDVFKQHALVAAFSTSAYSTTAVRTGKPFNPLLGETYECDRTEDAGWRAFSEQVSHHPPIAAQHVEGRGWKAWQDLAVHSKFRGKYIQVTPAGKFNLVFTKTNQHYVWNRVQSTVHNVIVGNLWVDQHGESDIINLTSGSTCRLTFYPYSYFSRQTQRKVKGSVVSKEGQVKWSVQGNWDTKMEILSVINDKEGAALTVWERNDYLAPQFYCFTQFACQLNELEEGVAPTDSRLRPDQRLLEIGCYDEATQEKLRLEEKQRAKRRVEMERFEERLAGVSPGSQDTEDSTYKPIWFRKHVDETSQDVSYQYSDQYWECKKKQDWTRCPDLF
uniref:Oxysterol-binding protein n=1 Tax=Cacopsylla melanoneura TaxID=428564 RepID=A0A8D8R439_9HEMI